MTPRTGTAIVDGSRDRDPAERPAPVVATDRVEAGLRARLGPKVIVRLTQNQSTMISFRERRGVLYLRLHTMFAQAPDAIVDAIARFVSGDGYGRAHADRLDAWIETHRPAKSEKPRRPPRPFGEVHDLQAIFDELNATQFDGRIEARITWGEGRPIPRSTSTSGARSGAASAGRSPRRSPKSRSSMQLGAYDEEAGEIRIHPALDQTWVPRFFVASVVFHEMLHEKHDAPLKNGRRQVHSARFLAEERRYPDYARARAWEAAHLDRLLAY